eukprot:scaffold2016_cov268-Chaetoceros_neogracile.AAC.2
MVPPPAAKKEREDHLPLTRHSALTDLHCLRQFYDELLVVQLGLSSNNKLCNFELGGLSRN